MATGDRTSTIGEMTIQKTINLVPRVFDCGCKLSLTLIRYEAHYGIGSTRFEYCDAHYGSWEYIQSILDERNELRAEVDRLKRDRTILLNRLADAKAKRWQLKEVIIRDFIKREAK